MANAGQTGGGKDTRSKKRQLSKERRVILEIKRMRTMLATMRMRGRIGGQKGKKRGVSLGAQPEGSRKQT